MIKITEIATKREWKVPEELMDFSKTLGFEEYIPGETLKLQREIFGKGKWEWYLASYDNDHEEIYKEIPLSKFSIEDTECIARDKILVALSKDESLKGSALYNDIFNICYGIPLSQIE